MHTLITVHIPGVLRAMGSAAKGLVMLLALALSLLTYIAMLAVAGMIVPGHKARIARLRAAVAACVRAGFEEAAIRRPSVEMDDWTGSLLLSGTTEDDLRVCDPGGGHLPRLPFKARQAAGRLFAQERQAIGPLRWRLLVLLMRNDEQWTDTAPRQRPSAHQMLAEHARRTAAAAHTAP